MLDEQSGDVGGGNHTYRRPKPAGKRGHIFIMEHLEAGVSVGMGDSGGASRFFYCAKSSRAERNAGCEGMEEDIWTDGRKGKADFPKQKDLAKRTNHHPTVKPLALMEYLCKLTKTPTGGIVLDPFAGSGTTGLACLNTQRKFILIEKKLKYIKIIKARIRARKRKRRLFDE